MKIEVLSNNLLETNTYLVIEAEKCLLIDPGSNYQAIKTYINKNYLTLVGVVLTHAHFDHFLSANQVISEYNVPLYVHHKSIPLLYDSELNVSSLMPTIKPLKLAESVEVNTLSEGSTEIDSFQCKVYHVPGHSPDHICLYFEAEETLFSGDTLFKLGIGRSDFLDGNENQLIKNIKNKLLRLPDETVVYPGHGNSTTIGFEKERNYYLTKR